MSLTKHSRRQRWTAVVGSLASCALLSGCFGSGDAQPAADHHTRHHSRGSTPTQPTDSPTSGETSSPPTTAPTSPSATSVLSYSPKSDGKHSHDCLAMHPGDDPAEFLYYPVLVKASSPVTLDGVTTQHAGGVVVAGSWVAPAASTPSTGTLPGWPPPRIFTQSSNVQWSKHVPAAGAALDPAQGWYNVFLRIQVDPTPGDSTMSGVQLTYHDASGSHTDTWVDHVTFAMSC